MSKSTLLLLEECQVSGEDDGVSRVIKFGLKFDSVKLLTFCVLPLYNANALWKYLTTLEHHLLLPLLPPAPVTSTVEPVPSGIDGATIGGAIVAVVLVAVLLVIIIIIVIIIVK